MRENIYMTSNFCDCRLCRGSHKVTNNIDKEAFNKGRDGFIVYKTGARNPTLITFNPKKFLMGHKSAAGNIDIQDPITKDWGLSIDSTGQEVLCIEDSVHSCHKISAHQEFLLFLRPEFYDTEVDIIETRV